MKRIQPLLFLVILVSCFLLTPSWAQESSVVLTPPTNPQQSDREQIVPSDKQKAETLLNEAREFLKLGQTKEVEDKLAEVLTIGDRLDTVGEIKKVVSEINSELLFSKKETSSSEIYTVRPGDSLGKIAKKFGINVGLIMRSNKLQNSLIRAGEQLKISKAKFSIVIDKSDHLLTVLSDGKFFKQYNVAVGKPESPTPAGSFSIDSRLENPTWFHKGKVIPAGDPENILGTRWLGFSIPGYGIHGTTLPETIGTDSTSGCIRMHNEEVEELYDIIPPKTWVTITD